jgi:hypothetical protein
MAHGSTANDDAYDRPNAPAIVRPFTAVDRIVDRHRSRTSRRRGTIDFDWHPNRRLGHLRHIGDGDHLGRLDTHRLGKWLDDRRGLLRDRVTLCDGDRR